MFLLPGHVPPAGYPKPFNDYQNSFNAYTPVLLAALFFPVFVRGASAAAKALGAVCARLPAAVGRDHAVCPLPAAHPARAVPAGGLRSGSSVQCAPQICLRPGRARRLLAGLLALWSERACCRRKRRLFWGRFPATTTFSTASARMPPCSISTPSCPQTQKSSCTATRSASTATSRTCGATPFTARPFPTTRSTAPMTCGRTCTSSALHIFSCTERLFSAHAGDVRLPRLGLSAYSRLRSPAVLRARHGGLGRAVADF